MSNNKDFKVKNGIQPTVYHEGLGTVVSAVEGYSLSAASYDGSSYNLELQDSDPFGVSLKSDGTKLYMLGRQNSSVFQYTLSTAYDVSTISYDSVSFSFSAQTTSAYDFYFTPDGTKLFVLGGTSVYQYTLSTAWDISTASYASKSFSVGTQESTPYAVSLSSTGNKLYVVGAGKNVYQYTLSTAFDVSTASYDSINFSVSSELTFVIALTFNGDGSQMFAGGSNGLLFRYNLTSNYNISTASYSGVSADLSAQVTGAIYSAYFGNSGQKLYAVNSQNNKFVFQYSTVLNAATLDISTGSVFDYTPTSDVQVTLSNPADSGTVSGATLLLEGAEATGVASTFSTTLYTGNSGTQTITNGIDLAGDGGMVWGKVRSISDNPWIVDSENGIGSNGTYNYLQTNLTTGLSNFGDRSVSSFNSDGFTLANSTNDQFNLSPETYVSWTFKKQAKFFDIVTYTGTGSAQTIAHNLGSVPGCIIVKQTNGARDWPVYHRGIDATNPSHYKIPLNKDEARANEANIWNDTEPTSTHFTVGSDGETGGNGNTYVAYLFAHDTDASSLIKCGSYTGTGSTGKAVTLGWEPQWLMIKKANAIGSWNIMDAQRGFASGNDNVLRANSSVAEITAYNYGEPTSTGFELTNDISVNSSGDTFIYIAIRAENIPTITYDPTLEWPGGTAPTAPAKGETDVVTFNTRDGGSTYQGVLAIDGAK